MGSAEILNGLRAMLSNVSTEADDFDEHAGMDRGVLRAAIAALAPEPITSEGLKERGFHRRSSMVLQRRLVTPGTRLEYWEGFREPFRLCRWSSDLVLHLPGIRTLADVDAMIWFLEGGA